ncbi:MAG: SDR family NAD(P)-dependent oxidoreductase [Alphaproteobacteria bacterium]|nr:SDR family NAD(P)-dependent oxidoreductase [Alphaproteobacteria bacterium]
MGGPVLVTGAGGFIGSHLVEELVRRGRTVRAFAHYNANGTAGWLDALAPDLRGSVEIVRGDIRDPDGVRRAVAGCRVVMHLAALISIPYSYQAPRSYVTTNIEGTLNVLRAAIEHEVERVVHTSTSEVYGTAQFVPISEAHPLNAQSPYAATKIAADQLALSFHRSFGLPVAVIRPFNAYGPRQSTRAVIPTIITQALAGRTRIRLGALHPTRDFNYVQDLAAAFVAVADSDAAIGGVVNAGSDFEVSIGEVLALIAEVIGVPLEAECDAPRLRPAASEVERLWADNRLIRETTGWRPAWGGREGFRRGLALTVDWYRAAGSSAGARDHV